MRTRHLTLALCAIAAAGGLAACSSDGGTSPASTAASSTAVTSASAAPGSATDTLPVRATTTVPASSPSSSQAVASGDRCAESQLRASVAADDIAGVSAHVVRLNFLNKSGSACTLYGWPGAAIVDSSGSQVQQAKRVEGGAVGGTIEKPRTVTVAPGASAYAYLEGSSTREQGAAQAGCDAPKYPRILVTPPNTDIPVPFTIGWPQCTSFRVHPIRID